MNTCFIQIHNETSQRREHTKEHPNVATTMRKDGENVIAEIRVHGFSSEDHRGGEGVVHNSKCIVCTVGLEKMFVNCFTPKFKLNKLI